MAFVFPFRDDARHRIGEPIVHDERLEPGPFEVLTEFLDCGKLRLEAEQVLAGDEGSTEHCRRIEVADHQHAAGAEHAKHFLEEAVPAVDMMERVDDGDPIDRLRDQWQASAITLDSRQAVVASPDEHLTGCVEDDPLLDIECPGGTSRPAAEVKETVDGPVTPVECSAEFGRVGTRHDQIVDSCEPIEHPDVTTTDHSNSTERHCDDTAATCSNMEFELLGWSEDGPTLRLDYEQFSYAGKFVMSNTGKAVVRDDGIVGAAAFDPDRTDDSTLRIRYVTVRRDRQGDGIGARLLRTVRERAVEQGFDRAVIAVNNPFAYEAALKAGFGYTGERTGVAERVLAWPTDVRERQYREGLESFRERALEESELAFIESRDGAPPIVEPYRS